MVDRIRVWSACALLAAALAPPVALADDGATRVDLQGSWYVLVHYTDPEEMPGQLQWLDRVWRFDESGRRLEWSEFVRFEFRDGSGRRETAVGDLEARSLGAWTPSPAQLAEIRRGLRIDGRGSRSKTLRGSPAQGYASSGSLHSESASVIGYHEAWRIDGLPHAPVFSRTDAMGSGRTEDLAGTTEYATDEVLDGGNELRGRFRRDGWVGTFRMIRMGEARASDGSEAR